MCDAAPQLLYYVNIPAILITLFIGGFVFWNNRGNLSNRLFFLFSISIALWIFFSMMSWQSTVPDLVKFFERLSVIGVTLPMIFLAFSYTFPNEKIISKGRMAILLIPIIPFILLSGTNLNITAIDTSSSACESIPGPLYYLMLLEVVFYVAFSVFVLVKKRQSSAPMVREQVKIIIMGFAVFAVWSVFTNLVAPLLGFDYLSFFGPLGAVVFMIFVAYAITAYQFLNSKVILAQTMTAVLVLVILAQFTYVRLPLSYALNGVALVIVSIAGYYVIRSVQQEVKRKEELEVLTDNLAKANARLKELDTAKSEFISIASHQLRTPLTAIKGYVSLLLEGSYGVLSQDSRDVLDKVYSVNDRLTHLVEDLLNVSRIEAGRIQYDFRPVQLADILTELYDGFMLNAKSKSLNVSLQLPTPPLPKILADPNKIKEVVSNLIDNSIKYTPEGSVTITLAAVGQNARITIADTGIGIKPEDKPNLFSKFTRSKETSRMVVGGAGLGLYVGKNFIDAHKGRIWADSEGPGKGSQFIVELPIVNTAITPGTTTQSRE